MKLNTSTALVTGGAVRIGRAICEALAARGCGVVIHYGRSKREAVALVREIVAAGGRANAVQGALDTPAGCARLMRDALAVAPGLNVLVNNASVFTKETLAAMTPKSLAREFQINLFAPMLLTQAFAKALGKRRGGVVNLVDRRIVVNEAGCIPYLLSKKGLAGFTASAALELAPGITVNAVAPGAVLPPPGRGGEKAMRDLAGAAPLRHRCSPADVARAVVFLLEQDGVTGQTVFVDSGQHLLGGA